MSSTTSNSSKMEVQEDYSSDSDTDGKVLSKEEKRKLSNRLAAARSRQKKQNYIELLENENNALKEQNRHLSTSLESIQTENRHLRDQVNQLRIELERITLSQDTQLETLSISRSSSCKSLFDPTLDSYYLTPLTPPPLDFLDSVRKRNGFEFTDTFQPFTQAQLDTAFENASHRFDYYGKTIEGLNSILMFSVTMWVVSTGKQVKHIKDINDVDDENTDTGITEEEQMVNKAKLKKAFRKLRLYHKHSNNEINNSSNNNNNNHLLQPPQSSIPSLSQQQSSSSSFNNNNNNSLQLEPPPRLVILTPPGRDDENEEILLHHSRSRSSSGGIILNDQQQAISPSILLQRKLQQQQFNDENNHNNINNNNINNNNITNNNINNNNNHNNMHHSSSFPLQFPIQQQQEEDEQQQQQQQLSFHTPQLHPLEHPINFNDNNDLPDYNLGGGIEHHDFMNDILIENSNSSNLISDLPFLDDSIDINNSSNDLDGILI